MRVLAFDRFCLVRYYDRGGLGDLLTVLVEEGALVHPPVSGNEGKIGSLESRHCALPEKKSSLASNPQAA